MHTIAPLAFCALAAIGLSFVADRIVDTAEELRARCLATLWGSWCGRSTPPAMDLDPVI